MNTDGVIIISGGITSEIVDCDQDEDQDTSRCHSVEGEVVVCPAGLLFIQ